LVLSCSPLMRAEGAARSCRGTSRQLLAAWGLMLTCTQPARAASPHPLRSLMSSAVSMLHKAFLRNAIDASALIVVMMMSEHGDLGGGHV
jgi:hypothetical protein